LHDRKPRAYLQHSLIQPDAAAGRVNRSNTMTILNNPDDGVTVTVTLVARGYLVRMIDDDSGGIVGDRIFPTESAALAYARKLVG
jgi:hypothetical protein